MYTYIQNYMDKKAMKSLIETNSETILKGVKTGVRTGAVGR